MRVLPGERIWNRFEEFDVRLLNDAGDRRCNFTLKLPMLI